MLIICLWKIILFHPRDPKAQIDRTSIEYSKRLSEDLNYPTACDDRDVSTMSITINAKSLNLTELQWHKTSQKVFLNNENIGEGVKVTK